MRIFLSHSTKDGDFVQRLATALEASGFTPWLCEVDIERDANFVAKINEGLAQSDLALLIWSQHAANSAWTLEEWTAALARQVEENRIRLGIVLLRDCPMPLPPLLRTKNYLDARANEDAGIDGVLGWLRKRQRVQRLSGLRAPVYLPDYRPQDFVGRSAYLARLQDALSAEPGVFLLYGEPGAGKSTLALRFAWDAQKDFDAVIFQTCGQRPLDAITAELVERLPIEVKTRPPEEQRAAAKAWLRERQSLLVLDGVWSAEMRQLEPGPNCSVLYTSRLKSLPGLSSELRELVESFTEEEAEALFHRYLDKEFGNPEVTRNREALLVFARRVEMLPIAVAVGASMLREKSASALDRAVLKLRLCNLTDGSKDVNALFRTAIASQPEREQKLLAAGAVCVQEGFWLPLAAEIAELSEDEADEAADRLVHSSLLRVVDRERRRFQLHSLLRDAVRAQQGSDGVVKLQERHAAALEKLFKDWETRWKDCSQCLEEIVPAVQSLWNRGDGERGWQLSYLGYSLGRRVGEWDAALLIMKHEQFLWEGRNEVQAKSKLAAIYNNQALVLKDWGDLAQAMELYRKSEAVHLALGDRRGLESSYGNQAVILYRWGRLEEAMTLHKKEEIIALELGDKTQLQRSYANQAVILYRWGRFEEAMALHKKEEAICIELENKDGLQSSLLNQALILSAWGRLDEALALYEKEESICQELGNKDGLQRSYGNRAQILFARDQRDEALALLKRQEIMCEELGNKAGLASCYANQATLMRVQGKLQESLLLHRKAEAIFLELGNRDGLGKSYSGQGLVLFSLGRFDEAMALYKKEEEICLGLGNKEELQACYANQALALLRSARLEEALMLLDKQENICLELGNKHGLGHCYWYRSCIAGAHGDRKAQKEKLEQALAIFTELKMPLQRDAVQKELEGRG